MKFLKFYGSDKSQIQSSHQLVDMREIDIIAPNLKIRHSGVTSTIFALCPEQRKLGQRLVVFGYFLPNKIISIGILSLLSCWEKPRNKNNRIWHARRNNEMLVGVLMRDVLKMPLKLIFTSSSQRNHTKWSRYLISRMDAVITTSKKSALFIKRPNTIIMHGINTERFYPTSDKKEARRHVKMPEHKKIIGCFGRIRKIKGTELFVNCMINILPSHPEWIAVVVGKTTFKHYFFKRKIQKSIQKAGLEKRILFIDEKYSIDDWYRALNIFIAPQLHEGFGLTALEAMASGIPVVAANVGVFSELLDPENEKAGIIFPAGDVHALEKAVLHFMNSEKIMSDTGNRGRERAVKHFQLTKEATAIGEIYDIISKK
ncbi:glycosyltransferase family 4 protein [Candidatus Liberibacter africanus]|uniref:Group 1 glycosyl transferase n=1 Tax=Candidatus Liberibacter africanus PTSAPSY TaxID=1277257 RepID=A0A0G3I2U7_LIBAF|nr:glycosyltransferase family 4 protein [Candidatus Liberibacter africanus]AKK20214.1 group 1 glycosyl transferase [Candidatus Liberibacter africanus PTSAPSY]QTP63993.1 glycosyltransferase family 4 protein [Candidatus Liberibacter africanus]